jgi:hypothetical protein
MKVDCIFRNPSGIGQRLYKGIELAALPVVGCGIEYKDGWGLATVEYVYILRESVEVGCRSWFDATELAALVADGWELRG